MTPAPSPRRYAFAGHRVDLHTRVLLGPDGAPVVLTAKSFDVLGHLLEHRDRVVDKAELLDVVWRGRVVEENSLTQAVSMLRRALGAEAGDHRYIVTVPGRGYRFVADVQVVPDEDPGAAAAPASASADLRWVFLAVLVLALGMAALFAWSARQMPAPDATDTQITLAVLPFRSLSSGSREPSLELGLAETIIARLGQANALRVRSLASAEQVASGTQDPMQAASQLGAAYVVEGSTQRQRDRVRVNVRLLTAPRGAMVWSGTFDEHIDRVFTLQDGIADAVLSALALPQRASARRSECEGADADAFRAYFTGRYQAQRPSPARLPRAMAAFRQAIDLDPLCAPAYVGMAHMYRAMVITGDHAPRDVFPLARAAVDRALRIDPDSAAALATRATDLYWYDWDWAGAERTAQRAVELNPSLPEAQFAYAHLLINLGRFEEGLLYARQARELDPLSPMFNALEGGFLGAAGRSREAHVRLQRALELEPDFWIALLIRGGMALDRGDTAAALADLQRSVERSHRNTQALAVLAIVHVAAGERARAEAILRELQARAARQYVPPSCVASVYNALGRTDAALDELERGLEARDVRMVFLRIDARWNNLRDHPRYQALSSRVGLAEHGGRAYGRF